MAIQLISINKMSGTRNSVTIQDTNGKIGIDESSNPIYKAYSLTYSSETTANELVDAEGEQSARTARERVYRIFGEANVKKFSLFLKELMEEKKAFNKSLKANKA